MQLILWSVIRKDVIRWLVSLGLNIVAVVCIVSIIVITSQHSEQKTDNDSSLVVMLVLVCVGLARMYLCLPHTEDSPSSSSHSARSLVEQLARAREEQAEDQHLQYIQSDLGLGNHFMSGFYRYHAFTLYHAGHVLQFLPQ